LLFPLPSSTAFKLSSGKPEFARIDDARSAFSLFRWFILSEGATIFVSVTTIFLEHQERSEGTLLLLTLQTMGGARALPSR
jgi:hypothetical protein